MTRAPITAAIIAGLFCTFPSRPIGNSNSSTVTTAYGTHSWGAASADADGYAIETITPSEAGAHRWYEWVRQFPNSSGTNDHVMRRGWDCGPGGGSQSGTKYGICDEWESRWVQAGKVLSERHIAFHKSDNTVYRGLTFIWNNTDNLLTAESFSDGWSFTDKTGGGVTYFTLNTSAANHTMLFADGAWMRHVNNNVVWLEQRNAAGDAYVPIVKVNASDQIELGSNTTTDVVADRSVGVGGSSFGNGTKVLFIANAGTVPSASPAGGGILYVEGGALKYRGSSGTITTLGNP